MLQTNKSSFRKGFLCPEACLFFPTGLIKDFASPCKLCLYETWAFLSALQQKILQQHGHGALLDFICHTSSPTLLALHVSDMGQKGRICSINKIIIH